MVGLVFKQQKYNILHEETEGYSKLNVILSDLPSYSYELYCKDKHDTDTDVEADVNQSKKYDHVDRQHRDDNNDNDNNNDGNDKEDDGNDKKRSSKAKMIVEEYISNVLSIIGHFDLDPNRVLDIIIDIYELHPYNFAYIYLLQRFRKESIVHVVGFKYSFYHIPRRLVSLDGVINSKDTGAATSNTSGSSSSSSSSSSSNAGVVSGRGQSQVPAAVASVVQDVNPSTSSSSVSYSDSYGHVTSSDTPRSLYIVTAMLIMYELIAIDDIIPYLRPSIDLLQNSLSAVDDSLKKQIVNYGVVSLTASSSNKRYNIINIIIIVNHHHNIIFILYTDNLYYSMSPYPTVLSSSSSSLSLSSSSLSSSFSPCVHHAFYIPPSIVLMQDLSQSWILSTLFQS